VANLLYEWGNDDRHHIRKLLANVQAALRPPIGIAPRFSNP
jgi:hypothetical protein